MESFRNIYKRRYFDYAVGKHYAQPVKTVTIFDWARIALNSIAAVKYSFSHTRLTMIVPNEK